MIRINLIPREERITTKSAAPNWMMIAAAVAPVIYLLVLLSVAMVQEHRVTVLDVTVQEEESTLAHYAPALEKIQRLTKEKEEVRDRLDALAALDRDRRLAVRLLEAVNRSVPSYLWIEKLEETREEGGELLLTGNTFSNLTVSDFLDRLAESELFEEVDLTITQEKRIGEHKVVEFSVTGRGIRSGSVEPGEATLASLFPPVEGG
ncbi:MAG: PilN domain-containing protein [Candidatus Eisenbacteria bacterium]|nr:PilN domain-containing protein [Candidatus Eisenbacteria bacterium]